MGHYYTIPEKTPDGLKPRPLRLEAALSLAGALRGEVVPVAEAEITPPVSQKVLRCSYGVFRRVKLAYAKRGNKSTIVDCWLRRY